MLFSATEEEIINNYLTELAALEEQIIKFDGNLEEEEILHQKCQDIYNDIIDIEIKESMDLRKQALEKTENLIKTLTSKARNSGKQKNNKIAPQVTFKWFKSMSYIFAS